MRPIRISIYIWLVIALLGVVCVLIPDDGWHIGPLQLRFPTLAEALDMQPQSTTTTLDSLAYIDEIDTIPATDSIAHIDTITAPQLPDSAKGLESPATVAPPLCPQILSLGVLCPGCRVRTSGSTVCKTKKGAVALRGHTIGDQPQGSSKVQEPGAQ